MPSTSRKQQRFFGAELGRKRSGQKTKTGLSDKKLSEFASQIKAVKHKSEHG